jgi:cytochrome c-type biogenesis protein CcmF
VATDSKAIHVGIYERQQDYIVMKAIIFPFIGVLWFGIVVMFSGLTYSLMRRTIGKYINSDVKA